MTTTAEAPSAQAVKLPPEERMEVVTRMTERMCWCMQLPTSTAGQTIGERG